MTKLNFRQKALIGKKYVSNKKVQMVINSFKPKELTEEQNFSKLYRAMQNTKRLSEY
jgi:division protein CdvB (Snf7/Vps24/ESCRT-III family)